MLLRKESSQRYKSIEVNIVFISNIRQSLQHTERMGDFKYQNQLHSGCGDHRIRRISFFHNSHSTCYSPAMFQNQYHRPTKHINRIQQLKIGITILLSFSSKSHITRKPARSTVSHMTNSMKSFELSMDSHSKNEHVMIKETDLLHRSRTTQRVVTENVIDEPIEYKSWYDAASTKISNISSYMKVFRQVEFDNWGRTYDEMKRGMYSWKSHCFKELKSNDCIYESACGIGMNLYMTLEILQQTSGVTNITISGNDFVSSSVQIAQEIYSNNGTFDHVLPSSFGQVGSIHEADSTKLDFIPSNSFDLVYTGYISPLNEPVDSKQSCSEQQQKESNSASSNVASTPTLAEQSQQLQNDWYGSWVGEMIRIAKPGVPIIVEQVSYP